MVMPPRQMLEISRALNIEGTITWDSIKYLGIPLVKNTRRNSLWTPVINKIKAKIQA